jgi:hypothetical protein
MAWVRAQFCKLQKRVHSTSSRKWKVYQLLAQGWWFCLGTPASSTNKTGHHDIAESGIKTPKNQSIDQSWLDTGTSIKSGGLN